MSRHIFIIALLVTLGAACNAAAQVRPHPYFPLQRGNTWEMTFSYEIGPGFYPPTDTLVVKDEIAAEKVATYFVLDPIIGFPDTLKTDDTLQIHAVKDGDEYLLFDFGQPDSTFYRIPPLLAGSDSGYVFVRHGCVGATQSWSFEDCIRFYFDPYPAGVDEEYSIGFARGIGPASFFSGWTIGRLTRASVGGSTITEAELPDRQESRLLSVFPNPLTTFATVEFETVRSGPIRIMLFDQLGRKQTTLFDGFASGGRERISLHVDKLPSALYLLVLEAAESRMVARIAVIR